MKKLLIFTLFTVFSNVGFAQTVAAIHGDCSTGNTKAVTQGLSSTNTLMVSYPQCTVAVYLHGGALATIYSDSSLTPLANPFTATTNGSYTFYAAVSNRYDVTLTGGNNGGFPLPYTIADIYLPSNGGGGAGCVPSAANTDVLTSDGAGACPGSDEFTSDGAGDVLIGFGGGNAGNLSIGNRGSGVTITDTIQQANTFGLGSTFTSDNSNATSAGVAPLQLVGTVSGTQQLTGLTITANDASGASANTIYGAKFTTAVSFGTPDQIAGLFLDTGNIAATPTHFLAGLFSTSPLSDGNSGGTSNQWGIVSQTGKNWFQDIVLQPETDSNTLFHTIGVPIMSEVSCVAAQRGRIHYKNTTPDVVEVCENTTGSTYAWVSMQGTGVTITTPNSTLNVGGTSTAPTLDVKGAAGKIFAGATPALTFTPALGVDGTSAGTLTLANPAAAFHTIFGSAATANNTILGFATAPTTGHIIDCTTSSTTCTLHDSGVVTANVVNASSPGAGIAHFAGSTQTVTSSKVISTDVNTSVATTGGDLDTSTPTLVSTVNGHNVAQEIYRHTSTAQTSAITATTMHTVSTAGSWRFSGDVNCTTASAAATAILTLAWTDTSSTVQTQSVTATCTTLGSSSVAQLTYSFRAKAGTVIAWSVAIANTPTFDVDVALESMNGVL